MGCGSSKSAVAAVSITNNDPPPTPKKTHVDNFLANDTNNTERQKPDIVKMTAPKHDILRVAALDDGESLSDIEDSENLKNSKNSTNKITIVKSAFIEDVKDAHAHGGDVCFGSVDSLRGSEMVLNTSVTSFKKLDSRECSASSRTSKDSGCVRSGGSSKNWERETGTGNEETGERVRGSVTSVQSKKSKTSVRVDSGSSQSSINNGKKTSSARQKLLRIQDDLCDVDNGSEGGSDKENKNKDVVTTNNGELEDLGENVICRPKSRFGNVAFDIVLDTPETGNAKKRPDKLPSLSRKQGKPKKRKTKKDIDKKLEEAEGRRKIAEGEKLLKAKQFQHFSVVTQVETFEPLQSGDEDEEEHQEKLLKEELSRLDQDEKADTTMMEKSSGVPLLTSDSLPVVSTSRGVNESVEQTAIESFHIDEHEDSDNEVCGGRDVFGKQRTSPTTIAAY